MTNTTHYNMTIAEGTDIVNPLTQIFPNFNTIDSAMYANKQSGIGTASEVTTGPVHAIVRANTDSNVFRFTATSAWTAGDTMTLDGNAVVVHMSDGTVPATGAYIIGAEVLAMVNSGLVTLAISSNGGVTSFNTRTGNVMPEASDYTASDIDFDNTNTTLTSTDVQGAIEEVSSIDSAIDSRVKSLEDSMGWKYLAQIRDHNPINVPTNAKEIFCSGVFGNMSVMFLTLVGGSRGGYYNSATDNGDIFVTLANSQLTVNNYILNGNDRISQGVTVYYR